jgi:putative heme transporter
VSAEATQHESLAERVERAIEARTDAEAEIARGEAEVATKGPSIRRSIFWLTITGISLYLVAPSLLDVLGSWQSLNEVSFLWFPLLALLQLASLACLWFLQRLAIPRSPWSAVIDSQLAGNALSKIAPGGGAMGAALQYKMLVERGIERGPAVAGITAVNLLTFGVVLGLPILALPALVGGSVNHDLLQAAIISLVVFVFLAAVGGTMLATDGPLRRVAAWVEAIRNRLRRNSPDTHHLPRRVMAERNRVRDALGDDWLKALVATVGRWAFDYAILLASLAAVGAHPRPGLVLLAFCVAQVLAQIPITPGGLGFVETGLTALLALVGVGAGDAVLATFLYRLFTYWLPLPLGLLGLGLHRRHYRGAHELPDELPGYSK